MAALQRPTLVVNKKETISSIFIGIDFGTSYTKVSYSYAPTQIPQIQTIKWGDDFFKQTILYVQNDKLYFDKPNGECQEVKYFKYSIIAKELKNNSQNTKNNFEEMCCVYFLAQVIKRSLSVIQAKLNIQDMSILKIYVNMGVPLENFYEESNKNNKGLYQDILENAILLAGGSRVKASLPSNQVNISNLDSVYSEILQKKAILNWEANVYPELSVELMLYHQSKFVPDGVYAIIDIGGGTVDMALFQKTTSSMNKNSYMYCLGQKVLPYGVEILQTTPNSVSAENFKTSFASMVVNANQVYDVRISEYKKLNIFFLGGGVNNNWYSNSIADTRNRLKAADIPPFEFSRTIEDFINSEESLLQKNQRLIISQMLARHSDDIEHVRGFPDFYEAIKKDPSYSENIVDKVDEDLRIQRVSDQYRD